MASRWLWTLMEKVLREWGYWGKIVWPSSPVASQNTLPGILPSVFLVYSRRLSLLQETFIFSFPPDRNSAIVIVPEFCKSWAPHDVTDPNSRLGGQLRQSHGPGRGHPAPVQLPRSFPRAFAGGGLLSPAIPTPLESERRWVWSKAWGGAVVGTDLGPEGTLGRVDRKSACRTQEHWPWCEKLVNII